MTLDCELFAIDNLAEFCFTGYPELKEQNRNFDVNLLRPHLIRCLENDKFESFSKVILSNEMEVSSTSHINRLWVS